MAPQYQQEESRIWRAQAEEARLLVVLRALPLTRGVTQCGTVTVPLAQLGSTFKKNADSDLVRLSEPGWAPEAPPP